MQLKIAHYACEHWDASRLSNKHFFIIPYILICKFIYISLISYISYISQLKLMSLHKNSALVALTFGIIFIGFQFLSEQTGKVEYQATCLKTSQLNSYLCAYCHQTMLKNSKENKKTLFIKNSKGIKALGIKGNSQLSCEEYIQLIDYKNQDSQIKDLKFQKEGVISTILQLIQSEQITQNGQTFLKNFAIDNQSYKSVVIYQQSAFPTMQTLIYQIQKDQVNNKLGSFLSISGIIFLFVVFFHKINTNSLKLTSLLNIILLLLVLVVIKQTQQFNEDLFKFCALIFFVICLLKVHTKSSIIITVATILILGIMLNNSTLIIIGYILSLFLFMIGGISQVYIWWSMCMFIGAHIEMMRIDETENIEYELCKMIKIVILTVTTTLIETFDDIIIKQYVDYTEEKKNSKLEQQGFEMLKQDQLNVDEQQ